MCVFRPAYIHTYIWMNSLTAMKLHHHKVRHTFAHGWAAQFPKHVVRGRMGNYQRCSFQLSPNSVFLRYNLERKVSFALLPCRGRQTTTWLIFKIYVLFAPNWKVKTLFCQVWRCLPKLCLWVGNTDISCLVHSQKNPLLFNDPQKGIPVKAYWGYVWNQTCLLAEWTLQTQAFTHEWV